MLDLAYGESPFPYLIIGYLDCIEVSQLVERTSSSFSRRFSKAYKPGAFPKLTNPTITGMGEFGEMMREGVEIEDDRRSGVRPKAIYELWWETFAGQRKLFCRVDVILGRQDCSLF